MRFAAIVVAAVIAGTPALRAQAPGTTPSAAPDVGMLAPDFSLPGASRYGLLRDPVRLADFRGKTVVLAFFYRARTKG
jgi:peroxiredoxin Q/BCP